MSIFYSENLSSRSVLPASGITDSLLSFDVSNSGIEKRLTLDELKKTGVQVVNVKQYGAVGDGVADDTAAIQAVLDTITQQRVYFPAGIYKVTSTLNIPSGAYWWTIEGDGDNSRIYYTQTDGTSCLKLNNAQHFHLKSFMVIGASGYANCTGIDFNTAARWSIEDISVRQTNVGVKFTEAFIGAISNLFIRYANTAFTGTAMNDVHGIIKTENCYKHFDIDDSYVIDLKLLGEGEARTATSTLDGCFNVDLDCYFEDNSGEVARYPEITVGATTRNSNINIRINYSNVSSRSVTFIADSGTDLCTASGHNFLDGDSVRLTTTSVLPSGLSTKNIYYLNNTTSNVFGFRISPSGSGVDILDNGTGVHTATFIQSRPLVALDNLNCGNIDIFTSLGNAHKAITITSNTKNVEIGGVDATNNPSRPLLLPASHSLSFPMNYFPDPLYLYAIPTLSNSFTTNAEETTIKPDFCTRSLKVMSSGSVTSNTAYITMTFAAYPHLNELKGRRFGVGWYQYYDNSANYNSTSTGNGPQIRVYPNGTGPTNSAERYSIHYRGAWHFQSSEGYCPSDATQIIVYYYPNAGSILSDSSMITYFVGPFIWIGGLDNVQSIMNGKYTNHPNALLNQVQTNNGTFLKSTIALTNGAASASGTLTNAPAAGNPTKWIPINDNGTTRYIPCW